MITGFEPRALPCHHSSVCSMSPLNFAHCKSPFFRFKQSLHHIQILSSQTNGAMFCSGFKQSLHHIQILSSQTNGAMFCSGFKQSLHHIQILSSQTNGAMFCSGFKQSLHHIQVLILITGLFAFQGFHQHGHIWIHSGTLRRALGKIESSFNRISWKHDKVLQTTREKALEHSKLIKTKGKETDGRPRQESARLPTDTAKFRFKAQIRHRSHQRIHQRHHYRRTYLSNGSAHDVLA